MTRMIRSYSELISLPTFKDRFNYLKLDGVVGRETFGYNRYINQVFYNSKEWKHFRRTMIIRDDGNDLACEGFEIFGMILVHHINPISLDDILKRRPIIFDPENSVITTLDTHNAIHYSDESILPIGPIERRKNDTCPWR